MQALGARQMVLGDLVEAGQVLDDAIGKERLPPVTAARAVDQVHLRPLAVGHQQIAPLEVVMREPGVVHAAGNARHLRRHPANPAPVAQAVIVLQREFRQIGRVANLFGHQRTAPEAAPVALDAVRGEPRGRDAPRAEGEQVLPFLFHARRRQPLAQAVPAPPSVLAVAGVAFHVIARARVLDANHFAERVLGDPLAAEAEHPVERAKQAADSSVLLIDPPKDHCPPAFAYLRR